MMRYNLFWGWQHDLLTVIELQLLSLAQAETEIYFLLVK
mgnify:CR=1 FL=1